MIAELFISGIQENKYLKPELTSFIQIGTLRCVPKGGGKAGEAFHSSKLEEKGPFISNLLEESRFVATARRSIALGAV
jgi:hypothetical protein